MTYHPIKLTTYGLARPWAVADNTGAAVRQGFDTRSAAQAAADDFNRYGGPITNEYR